MCEFFLGGLAGFQSVDGVVVGDLDMAGAFVRAGMLIEVLVRPGSLGGDPAGIRGQGQGSGVRGRVRVRERGQGAGSGIRVRVRVSRAIYRKSLHQPGTLLSSENHRRLKLHLQRLDH